MDRPSTRPLLRSALVLLVLALAAPVQAQDRQARPPRPDRPPDRTRPPVVQVSPEALRLAHASPLPVVRLNGPGQAEVAGLPPEGAAQRAGEVIGVPALDAAARRRVFQQHPDWPPPPPERDFHLTAEDPDLRYVRLTARSPWHPRASLYFSVPVEYDAAEGTVGVSIPRYPQYGSARFLDVLAELEGGARYLVDLHITPTTPVEFSFGGVVYDIPEGTSVKHVMTIIEPTTSDTYRLRLEPPYEDAYSSFVLHAVEITKLE